MARCNECNKFASFGEPEIEVDSSEVSRTDARTLVVTASVEIKRNCADCGTTLRTGSFDVEQTVIVPKGEPDVGENDDLSVEVDDPEPSERVEGKGRGAKTFIGFTASGTVTVKPADTTDEEGQEVEGKEFTVVFDISDEMQASHFDEA